MRKILLLAATSLALTLGASPAFSKEMPNSPKSLEKIPNKVALANWPKSKTAKDVKTVKSTKLNGKVRSFATSESGKTQNFKCALIYAYDWDEDAPQYGAYSFGLDDVNNMTRLYTNTDAPVNSGGFFTDDKFIFTSYVADSWGYDYTVTTYVVNTNTWEVEQTVDQGSLYARASDLAYDPIEKMAFGTFYSDDDDSSYWGFMNPSTCEVTQIVKMEGNMAAVAANAQGEIYGITSGGYLVKIDKYSGSLTTIGNTNITPAYMQSAAFGEDGTLYWAAGFTDGSTGLFTVDTTTAKVQLIQAWDEDEEVVALYAEPAAADPGAPKEATNLSLNFVKDSLSGKFSFDVPAENNLGETMSGNVTYIVSVDSEDKYTGTAAAGTTATVDVSVAAAGVHSVSVRLKNDVGESRRTSVSQWVGIDRPVAVTDLVMEKTGSLTATISWTAPDHGVLNGYFDPERISYTVTRMPEDVVVASGLKATTYNDVMTDTNKKYITYKVTPYADTVAGNSAVSNGAVFGNAMVPPVSFDFATEADYNIFTVIDNNETVNLDSGMWEYSPSGECAGYVCGTQDGDDWMITPEIQLYADRQYTFKYNTLCYGQEWPDKYEVYMGKDATIEAMTTELVPPTTIYWEDYRTTTLTITVPEDGTYNFGFHALSEAGGAFFLVDDISLVESYKLKAPQAVTDLKAVAGDKGALTATVSFTLPTLAVDGSSLDALTKAVVLRDGREVKSFNAPALGSQLSFEDSDLDEGEVSYRVLASNASGDGVESDITVWVGLDTPCAPATISTKVVNGHPVISWEAPAARGENGGYVDFDNLSYIVYRVNDSAVLAQDYKEFSYVDEETEVAEDGDQSICQYGVFAKANDLIGQPAAGYVLGGACYETPFAESFTNGTSNNLWISSGTEDDYWTITNDWSATPQDDDKGLLLITPYTPGSVSSFLSGKINMRGAKNPMLSFYLEAMSYTGNDFAETNPADDYLEVLAAGPDYNFKTVKTIYPNDLEKGQYLKQTISLADFAAGDYVMIGFRMNSVAAQSPIAIDNILIASSYDVNLKLADLTVPAKVKVTQPFTATATVYNDGANDATGYTVNILYGDDVLASVSESETLGVGESRSYDFEITAAAAWENEDAIEAEVVMTGDENAFDNSREADFEMWRPDMPVVDDFSAEPCDCEQPSYLFSWSAPEISEFSTVNEGFEDYAHGSLSTIGNWTSRCDDGVFGADDYIVNDEYIDIPHPFSKQAFMVFDPAKAGIDLQAAPEWAPHSGTQMLVSFGNWENDNDDWIISPELSGEAQTITFWARSPKDDTDKVGVYTSEAGTGANDFSRLEDGRITLTNEWKQYSYDLKEGTKYFAIRNNQTNGYCIMLDDIAFKAVSTEEVKAEILGYNLYCDDVKVNNELIAETGCGLASEDVITGNYYVTVVYNVGESEASNRVYVESSGVNNVSVEMLDNQPVYDLFGRRVNKMQYGQVYVRKGEKFVHLRK
jgi:hypothetical protein